MNQTETDRIVDEVADLVATKYVYPDQGERIARELREAAAAGRYAGVDQPERLAAMVTEDLERLSADGHLRLLHHRDPITDQPSDEVAEAVFERRLRTTMSGIGRVERLDGNIGLIEFQPALFGAHLIGEELTAVMTLVRHTSALIIDLRGCGGGDPDTIAYLCSYLLPPGTHLNDVYDRTTDHTTQSRTLLYVPGPHYGAERPVYVLTSRRTFSGGEELANDLRETGRATLVGENTGGGAHLRIGVRVHDHLEASIPTGRPINPVTGTDWEGVGVEPHIHAAAADALKVAHERALADTGADTGARV